MGFIFLSMTKVVCQNCVVTIEYAEKDDKSRFANAKASVLWNNGVVQLFETKTKTSVEKHIFIIPHPEQGFYYFKGRNVSHVINDKTQIVVLTEHKESRQTAFDNMTTESTYYFPMTDVLIIVEDGGDRDYIWWWNLSVYKNGEVPQDANFDKPCEWNGVFNDSLSIYKTQDHYAIGTYFDHENKYTQLLIFDTANICIERYDESNVPNHFVQYLYLLEMSDDEDDDDEDDNDENDKQTPKKRREVVITDPATRELNSKQRQFMYSTNRANFNQSSIDEWMSSVPKICAMQGLQLALNYVICSGSTENMILLLGGYGTACAAGGDSPGVPPGALLGAPPSSGRGGSGAAYAAGGAPPIKEMLDYDLFSRHEWIERERPEKWDYLIKNGLYVAPAKYPDDGYDIWLHNIDLSYKFAFWYRILTENGWLNEFYRATAKQAVSDEEKRLISLFSYREKFPESEQAAIELIDCYMKNVDDMFDLGLTIDMSRVISQANQKMTELPISHWQGAETWFKIALAKIEEKHQSRIM